MVYSAGKMAEKLGVSKDTLRYYEKEGLLPPIPRNESGHRVYSDADAEWIFLVRCLRDTDMPIQKIKTYVALLMNSGGESIHQRRQILLDHQAFIEEKMKAYYQLKQLIDKKIAFYDEALASDDPSAVKCLDYSDEWEHFRRILEGFEYE